MNAFKTLSLIASNASELNTRGNEIFNAGINECLTLGWVTYAPGRRVGYRLTARGKAVMSAARTGIPLPPPRKGVKS